jgi:hypothetical protein
MSNISKPASIRNRRAPSSTIERGVVSLRSPDAMQHVSAASLIRVQSRPTSIGPDAPSQTA